MVNAFSDANKVKIACQIALRRPGDIAACYADASKAKRVLDWQAELNVSHMVKDSWHWQSKNPSGYN